MINSSQKHHLNNQLPEFDDSKNATANIILSARGKRSKLAALEYIFLSDFLGDTREIDRLIADYHRIIHLDAHNCSWLTDEDFTVLANLGSQTQLKSLNLSFCSKITDLTLFKLSQTLPNLELLYLEDCVKITYEGIGHILSKCKELKLLDLSNCSKLKDATLSIIGDPSNNIESLNLKNCTSITDKGLADLSEIIPNFEYLNLGYCSQISDTGISDLFKFDSLKLKKLSLEYCYDLSDNSLNIIREKCPNLTRLNISACNNLTYEGIANFLRNHNSMKKVILSDDKSHLDIVDIQSLRYEFGDVIEVKK